MSLADIGGEKMRRSHRIGAVAAAAMLAVMIVPVSMAAGNGGAKWTFAIYLDADNNLEPYALMNLEWLEKVGSNDEEIGRASCRERV